MIPLRPFDIHQPATTREASEMLAHYGDEAGFYAGGTELLLAMKQGALSYKHLIDLKGIPGVHSIEVRDGSVEIGAVTTHRSIERLPFVRQKQPALAELESQVANVRVRAAGTLGGNLCFAEPHSDPATLLLVLGATLKLEGSDGTREMALDKFIAGAYANNLRPNEILAKIVVPCTKPSERSAYMKFQVHERPTLGLALWLEVPDAGHTVTAARVAVGCACPFPTRVLDAENLLAGSREQVEKRLPETADAIGNAADLVDDNEGSVEYKRHLIHVFLRRVFRKALAAAKEGLCE